MRECSMEEGRCGEDLADDFSSRKLNCDVIKIPHHGSAQLSPRFVKEADAEHVLISAADTNKSHHHPRQVALDTYELFGATNLYSTSVPGENHLTLTIGPSRNQFTVNGAQTGWTYWRDLRGNVEEDTADACETEEHKHYCLETR